MGIHDNVSPNMEFQEPAIALVFNISAPNKLNAEPLLTLSDLETLYHEWGHALHSLFSRTIFQHLSGTRGAVDFVEVPSHLFEYFARSPSIIQQWARNHRTGQRPPLLLLEEALLARNPFGAIETQTQLLLSAADQHIFGPGIGDVSALSPTDIYQKAVTGVVQIQQKLTHLPFDNHNPAINLALHSHFVNYGAGYYSYLFAKMYAAQIWEKRFKEDPLSRANGIYLWNNMLQFGAAKNTNEMLTAAADGELDPAHFLRTLL